MNLQKTGFLIAVFMVVFILSHSPARAASCYSPVEAEADQAIRIHSELMVIGLSCQHLGVRHGENLYGDYKTFTRNNADLFETYEKILMHFYKKQGQKPEAHINALRTSYANKISTSAAQMRPDLFCSRYAPRIKQALEMDQDNFRRWAATIYDTHPVSYPVCASF